MKKRSRNPIAFRPLPVTIITTVVYAALLILLLVVHLIVPSAPKADSPVLGINITEAWNDLQILTNGYHPYNSHKNDDVRNWLLQRLDQILTRNGIQDQASQAALAPRSPPRVNSRDHETHRWSNQTEDRRPVVIFNDLTSNVTGSRGTTSVYFEGTNIIVYVRGTEDDKGAWWNARKAPESSGVLVNAHYDSVSTGFGATDDGIGIVSVLQLISHFTITGNQPKKGMLALFNNGEEDYLNGARAFTQHPTSQFAHAFLNLEGAGAGGRASLFRTTDAEVTRFYQGASHPFGTVLSGDGFKRGLIRSQTDYVIFNEDLGMRGLDVAFFDPRARYHTDQDDARHTGKDSLWHMLSNALSTMQSLTDDTSSTFDGKSGGRGKVASGLGSDGVWFDLFGMAFAVFQLKTLYAISITLLVVGPVSLIVIAAILYRVDKLYLFSSSKTHHHPSGDDSVPITGWRGFFRYPVIFILAAVGVVGLAFVVTKFNPYIVYSSPYSIWSMMFSAWIFIVWFFSRAIDFLRPTAFHRTYTVLWMFLGGWVVLVLNTVLQNNYQIAGGYFMVFYVAAIYLATSIGFLELFGLPRKGDYADAVENHRAEGEQGRQSHRSGSMSSGQLLAPAEEERATESNEAENPNSENDQDDNEEATESTSLLRNSKSHTFAHYVSPIRAPAAPENPEDLDPSTQNLTIYGFEQPWSASLPTWTWLLQFLLMSLTALVFIVPIALLILTAAYQTPADGNPVLPIYLSTSIFTILILAPLSPFAHRMTSQIPLFLLCVLVGTLIYNIVAFPFSPANRLKVYFVQTVDLDTGINKVQLSALAFPFLEKIVSSLPSATNQNVVYSNRSSARSDLVQATWTGLPPRVVPNTHPEIPPELSFRNWMFVNVTRGPEGSNTARILISAQNSRGCKIDFDPPVTSLHVEGSASSPLYKPVGDNGTKELMLWSREWGKTFDVQVAWEGESETQRRDVQQTIPDQAEHDVKDQVAANQTGLNARVACWWNDDNVPGSIPALRELRRYAPTWVALVGGGRGLVEGSKGVLL